MTRGWVLWVYIVPFAQALPVAAAVPPSRYTFPVAGAVYDTYTKLTWQRDVPASYAPSCSGKFSANPGATGEACTQDDARRYCASLTVASGSWRLPTRAELLTIVDPTRFTPPIDTTAFPNTPSDWSWSSSPYVGASGSGWLVNFYDGGSYMAGTGYAHRVGCVR